MCGQTKYSSGTAPKVWYSLIHHHEKKINHDKKKKSFCLFLLKVKNKSIIKTEKIKPPQKYILPKDTNKPPVHLLKYHVYFQPFPDSLTILIFFFFFFWSDHFDFLISHVCLIFYLSVSFTSRITIYPIKNHKFRYMICDYVHSTNHSF